MPKDYSKDAARSHRPHAVMGTDSFWVGGPVPPYSPNYHTSATKPAKKTASKGPGVANRLPTEIALKISKHLNPRDLAKAAVVWRPLALASYASPEFIQAECGRFSLVTNKHTWRPEEFRIIRDRMEQYNFAWTTLQYSGGQFFSIPETTNDTPWAGSHEWRSGNWFMGESNGYLYSAASESPGPTHAEFRARVCLYQAPSLRNGVADLKRRQFDVACKSHFIKAVSVDPVARVVAILEFNNTDWGHPYSRIPYLHVYQLIDGKHIGTVQMRVGFQVGAEIYHMELHGGMVCMIAHFQKGTETASEIRIQNWAGAQRYVSFNRCTHSFITGFQFLTEDTYIITEKGKEELRDQIQSNLVTVGHIRTNTQQRIDFTDPGGEGWTPNNISLIRNISPYQPVDGKFSSDPSQRLFGLRYDYFGFDNVLRSRVCLFGRTTVESWLGIRTLGPVEPIHWAVMPLVVTDQDTIDFQLYPKKYDPTNPEGAALIGRRLFWSVKFPSGWGLNVIDYNPGSGIHIDKGTSTRGQYWESSTSMFCVDPYTVTYSSTTRITHVKRIIPTEDGILIKQDDHGAPTFMALLM